MSIEITDFWLGFGFGLLVMFLFISLVAWNYTRKHPELVG